MYLLVGECRNRGSDGLIWRRHLINQLCTLLELDLVAFVDAKVPEAPLSSASWLTPTSTMMSDCLGEAPNLVQSALLEAVLQLSKLREFVQCGSGIHVATKRELLAKDEPTSHQATNARSPLAGVGDCIVSLSSGTDENLQLLILFRSHGEPPFSHRVTHLIRSLWLELCHFQPQELTSVEASVFRNYPKRMLQVLACILDGNTAKETAELLSISFHTVQEHIKRLYKRTGTSNRAELAEFFREVAPQLIATPLDQFSVDL